MRKLFLVLVGVTFFGAVMLTNAFAAQKCWEAGGGFFKVSITNTLDGHALANGVDYVPGSFLMPIVGVFEKDADGVHKRLSLHGTNNSIFFSGFMDCVFDAVLDPTTTPKWSGTLNLDCGAGNFVQTFPMNRIPCSSAPAPLSAPLAISGGETQGKK